MTPFILKVPPIPVIPMVLAIHATYILHCTHKVTLYTQSPETVGNARFIYNYAAKLSDYSQYIRESVDKWEIIGSN